MGGLGRKKRCIWSAPFRNLLPFGMLALVFSLAVLLSGCVTADSPADGSGKSGSGQSENNYITWVSGFYGEYNFSVLSKGSVLINCTVSNGSILPDWLALDSDGCTAIGTAPPLDPGTTKKIVPVFTVRGLDSLNSSRTIELKIAIIVVGEAPELIPIDSNYCKSGEPCAVEVARAEKGSPPYRYSSSSFLEGAPPIGTAIDLAGVLKGKPGASGRYRFGVCVTDSNGASDCETTGVIVQKGEGKAGQVPREAGPAPRNFTLAVRTLGEGKGAIFADQGSLLCGETSTGLWNSCEVSYPEGTALKLYAIPLAGDGSSFREWSGGCLGEGDECEIIIDSGKTVGGSFDAGASATVTEISCRFVYKAHFNNYLEYVFELSGSGTASGPPGTELFIIGANSRTDKIPSWTGIPQTTARNAKRAYSSDPLKTAWSTSGLLAIRDKDGEPPSTLDTFNVGVHVYRDSDPEGYPGAIELKAIKCVRPDETANLTKLFVETEGLGAVASFPEGIDCGTECGYAFISGENVTLYATPAQGASFIGWGGACSGPESSCNPLLDSERVDVSAEFSGGAKSAEFTIDSAKCVPAGLGQAYYSGGQEYLFNLEATGTVSGPVGSRLELSRNLQYSTHGMMYSGEEQVSGSWTGKSERSFDSTLRLQSDPEKGTWKYSESGFIIVSGGGVNWPGPGDISINVKVWTPEDSGYLSVATFGGKEFSCSPN